MADLGDLVMEQALLARERGGITGITTGWPSLDLATRGWQNGDFYVILARPKMGKSLIMINSADAAHAAGYTPLVVSMEMSAEQMARRHFARRASLNMNLLQRGQLSTFGERRLAETISTMKREHPYHFIEGQFKKDIGDLSALVQSLQPHIVFIDGGYLLKMRRSQARAKWEMVTDIAQELKSMAGERTIPVIASFQLTREVKQSAQGAEFGNIQLADAIGQLASAGIGVFETRDPDSYTGVRRRLIKPIGGREGQGEIEGFEIYWDWNTMNFNEVIDEYGLVGDGE
jgi:replicative DNA helicase